MKIKENIIVENNENYYKKLYQDSLKLLQEKEKELLLKDKEIKSKNDEIALKENVIFSQKKEIIKRYQKIKKLLDAKKDLNLKIKALIETLDSKNAIIKKENFNKYYSKSEETKKILNNSRIVNKKTKSTKVGRPVGSKNFNSDPAKFNITKTIYLTPEEIKEGIKNGLYEKIGEDKTVKLIKEQKIIGTYVYVREKYRNKKTGEIFQAPSDYFRGNSPISNSLVSSAISLKYELDIPITKLSKLIENEFDITISSQNWCNYFEKTADFLSDYYNKIEKEFLTPESKVII